MVTPIIINNTTTRNCIIHDNIRYCEDNVLDEGHLLGATILTILFMIFYITLPFFIHYQITEKYNKDYSGVLALIFVIIIPFVVGVYLIF